MTKRNRFDADYAAIMVRPDWIEHYSVPIVRRIYKKYSIEPVVKGFTVYKTYTKLYFTCPITPLGNVLAKTRKDKAFPEWMIGNVTMSVDHDGLWLNDPECKPEGGDREIMQPICDVVNDKRNVSHTELLCHLYKVKLDIDYILYSSLLNKYKEEIADMEYVMEVICQK